MDAVDRIYECLLVLRCQAGDEAAFEQLVERYHARLQYFLARMLRGIRSDEDVLQDLWLDVYRGVGRLKDPGAFRAWLYRLARDRAFRELRRRRLSWHPLQEDDIVEEVADDDEFSEEDARRVHAGLDEVGPEHKEVLVLRFVEGMSYEEIARVTGCQLGTVRSRLHYAKHALRRALERMNDHDRGKPE